MYKKEFAPDFYEKNIFSFKQARSEKLWDKDLKQCTKQQKL